MGFWLSQDNPKRERTSKMLQFNPIKVAGYSKKQCGGTMETLIVQLCFKEQIGKIQMECTRNRTGTFSKQTV